MITFIFNKIKICLGIIFISITLFFTSIVGLIIYYVSYPYFRIIDLFKSSQKQITISPISETDPEEQITDDKFSERLLNLHISLINNEKEQLAKRLIDRVYFKESIERSVNHLRKNEVDPAPIIKIASESGITIN